MVYVAGSYPPIGPYTLRKIVPRDNVDRYYVVETVVGLGDVPMLMRNWGRSGTFGRLRLEQFSTIGEAEVAKASIVADKLRDGYRPGPWTGCIMPQRQRRC